MLLVRFPTDMPPEPLLDSSVLTLLPFGREIDPRRTRANAIPVPADCDRKNPQIFDQLLRELNDLLEVKHRRIHPSPNRRSRLPTASGKS